MQVIHISSIWAIMQRHLLLQFRDMYRIVNLLFWPFFDVLIWSYMSMWTQSTNSSVLFIPVIGSFFWQACSRTSADIAASFLDELFSKNIMNMFSSPLSFVEYMLSLTFISALRLTAILMLCGLTIWFIMGLNIFMFGWWLVPLLTSFFMSGVIMALFSSALLLRWGMRAMELIWVVAWCLSAFVGVFYPVEILPVSFQMVGKILPMTYAYKAIHHCVATGIMVPQYIALSFLMNALYGIIALLVVQRSFTYACKRGLARLEAD